MDYKIAVIPGDGIGPEIVREAWEVAEQLKPLADGQKPRLRPQVRGQLIPVRLSDISAHGANNYIRPCAIMASIMITTIKTLSRLRAAALYAAGGRAVLSMDTPPISTSV